MTELIEWHRIAVRARWTKPWRATTSRSSSEQPSMQSDWRWARARLGVGRLSRHVARSEYDEHSWPAWNRCPDTVDSRGAHNGVASKSRASGPLCAPGAWVGWGRPSLGQTLEPARCAILELRAGSLPKMLPGPQHSSRGAHWPKERQGLLRGRRRAHNALDGLAGVGPVDISVCIYILYSLPI